MKMIDEQLSKALSDEIIRYINNRRDIKEEHFLKDKPKKNKQGLISNGAIIARLSVVIKKTSDHVDDVIRIEKAKKSKIQTNLEFQRSRYEQLLSLVGDVVDSNLVDIKNEYHEFLLTNREFFNPVTWLTNYSIKAKDISFATHVGKLTHSSSKSSSILDVSDEKKECYLTTNSLHNIEVDTASSNAASLPIADILKITVDGVSVLDCLKNNDKSLFENLTDNEVLINEWCEQLKQTYDRSEKQSYFLSKQTYFPVEEHQYHLLLPLTSSSLVHAIHLKHKAIWDGKKELDTEQRVANTQRNKKKFSEINTCVYLNKAILNITSNLKAHSNVSRLNLERQGKVPLLSTIPPQWQSSIPSYVNKTDVFDRSLSFVLKAEMNDLKKYLVLIKNKSLSISEPKRNAAVINKLRAIAGNFFNYIEQINSHTAIKNWTVETHLPIEQQLLFEYSRDDDKAVSAKQNKQWMKILSKSYGRWLNNQLKDKDKLPLTLIHEAVWADAFLIELREFVATQEVTL
ncbi:type I-F CRISPR-associated protein Csy1 [Thalassotalea piscium]